MCKGKHFYMYAAYYLGVVVGSVLTNFMYWLEGR